MKYIYMFRAGERAYKVGVSNDILKRVKSIQTSSPERIEIVISRPVDNANMVEKKLHEWLVAHRANGGKEWFDLTPIQALELVIKMTNFEEGIKVSDHLVMRELSVRQSILEKEVEKFAGRLNNIELSYQKSRQGKKAEEAEEPYDEAMMIIRTSGRASASLLQRRMKIGYARAARLLDELEKNGVVGPANAAKPREVLPIKQKLASL